MATKKTTGKATPKTAPQNTAAPEKAAAKAEPAVDTKPTAAAKPAAKPGLKPAPVGGMLREITARPMMQGNPYLPMPATVPKSYRKPATSRPCAWCWTMMRP